MRFRDDRERTAWQIGFEDGHEAGRSNRFLFGLVALGAGVLLGAGYFAVWHWLTT